MIRLGSKEMRSNTSPPLTRSQTYPLESMPPEMKEEILMKLKGKYISKFISVSKSWSSMVRSKVFTNLYLNRSLAQTRILLSLIDRGDREKQVFHSFSQEDPPSDHHTVSCNRYHDSSPPVRGLICCLNVYNLVMIGNPSTSQFITLPRVISMSKDTSCFFGYDPVRGEYKVLCTMVPRRFHHLRGASSRVVASQEHQVFTLGATRKRWRSIECQHPHQTRRRTQGICSNGVVYYLAWIQLVRSLICFDVRSEKFSVIELPRDVQVQLLSNYGEKIAVTNLLINGTLDLWVLEDASRQVWSKVSVVIPSWNDSFRFFQTEFKFRGTLGTGELVFAPKFVRDPYFLLCYNLKENKARKINIQGIGSQFTARDVYLDHVESHMILEPLR